LKQLDGRPEVPSNSYNNQQRKRYATTTATATNSNRRSITLDLITIPQRSSTANMSTTTIKALVLDPKTAAVTLKEVAKPSPGAGEILIRVKAISLNMLDGLLAKYPIADSERVIGLDFAGVVEGAGDDLAASGDKRTKSGTRVSGFLQGGK
jgi:hypothetical protein